MSDMKYNDLNNLLDESSTAYSYFSSLPQYIREMISSRGDKIHTEKDLHSYADNLLSGDK